MLYSSSSHSVADPYVFGPPGTASGSVCHQYGSGSLNHQAKIVRIILFSTLMWLLWWLFIFEEWCKWLVFRIRRIRMFLGLPDPHPDSLVRGTDHRIRIRNRTKMSWIRNTGVSCLTFRIQIRQECLRPWATFSGHGTLQIFIQKTTVRNKN